MFVRIAFFIRKPNGCANKVEEREREKKNQTKQKAQNERGAREPSQLNANANCMEI